MKKYIGILLVFMLSLFAAPVIADSTNIAGDAAATVKAVNSTVETVATNVEGVNKNLVFVSDKIESAITQLSAKLGVAAEKVWGILVRQAVVNSWVGIAVFLLNILFFLGLLFTHFKFLKRNNGNHSIYYEYEELAVVPIVLLSLTWLAWFIVCIVSLPDILTGLINPDYSALKEVLRAL